jgi:hypothetical protein
MAGFSAEWLALREPADHAARSADLTRAVLGALQGSASQQILDLAAGTGSNLRYLTRAASERTRPPNNWLLVDHDPVLLSHVPKSRAVDTSCVELSTLGDCRIFEGRTLVTASALLDLVSEEWLRTLTRCCAHAGAAVLFALTYDGRIVCSPSDPDDDEIVPLVNLHQRTDKGFGPALGPDATEVAARAFEAVGYRVQRARSDWMLPPEMRELQRQLIDGWAHAAVEIAPARESTINAWRNRRLAHVAAGRSQITVGHEDLAAWPL